MKVFVTGDAASRASHQLSGNSRAKKLNRFKNFNKQVAIRILRDYHKKLISSIDKKLMDVIDLTVLEAEEKYFKAHFSRYLRMLQLLCKSEITFNNFLDIGPSFGHFSWLISNYFHCKGYTLDIKNTAHIEVSKMLIKGGFKCKFGNVLEIGIPYDNEQFDLVIFTEVLEHIPQSSVSILSEIHRVLKRGGHLFITTLNALRVPVRIGCLLGRNPFPPFEDYQNLEKAYLRHWREYTLSECVTLAEKTSFKVYKQGYINFYSGNFISNNTLRFIFDMFYKTLTVYPPFRDSLMMIARK